MYLQDVFERIPTISADELLSVLPDQWIKEHPEHPISQRVSEALDRAERTREHYDERMRAAA